jgi:hypothetical protein
MSGRILVIIGARDLDQTIEAVSEMIDDGTYRSVYLVGVEYRSLQAADLPLEVVVIPDEPARVFTPKVRESANGVPPPFQAPMYYSAYYKRMSFLSSTDAAVTFICVESRLASNIFELAAFVYPETVDSSKRLWLVIPDDASVSAIANPNAPVAIPDIFTGSEDMPEILSRLSPSNTMAFKALILQGIDTLRCFLRAGYHVLENNEQVPGWALQATSPWNALLIGIFQIIPGSIDKTHRQEMQESALMRKLLTDASLFVLSNYFANALSSDVGRQIPSTRDLKAAYEAAVASGASARRSQIESRNKILSACGEEYLKDMTAWSWPPLWDSIRVAYASMTLS